ncbi:MAG TPA: FAD-dependent oxidoreductase [Alphaproteobacteria bacterium]|nr:FAD-dependent oxidoreductase [Alphaproteobacteria bacterium]
MTKAIVIGGGVVGALSAYYLAQNGLNVTLLEKNKSLGLEASAANANQLSYSHIFPPVSPSMLPKLPGILMGGDATLKIRALRDPRFWSWALRAAPYLLSASLYRKTSDEIKALHTESRSLMAGFVAKHDIPFSFQPAGRMMLFDSVEEAEGAYQNFTNHGLGAYARKLTRAEALEQEPGLAHSKPFAAAVFTQQDETGDCEAFVRGLESVLKEMGVRIRTGTYTTRLIRKSSRIEGVELQTGKVLEADIIVLTNGARAPELLKTAGLNAPIYPVKGYTYEIPMKKPLFKASIVDVGRKMVLTPLDHSLKVSNGMLFQPMGRADDAKFLEQLKSAAASIYPDINFSKAILRSGYRPWTPSSLPIVARKLDNLYVNIGHGMLGWTMAQATAFRLARLVKP